MDNVTCAKIRSKTVVCLDVTFDFTMVCVPVSSERNSCFFCYVRSARREHFASLFYYKDPSRRTNNRNSRVERLLLTFKIPRQGRTDTSNVKYFRALEYGNEKRNDDVFSVLRCFLGIKCEVEDGRSIFRMRNADEDRWLPQKGTR